MVSVRHVEARLLLCIERQLMLLGEEMYECAECLALVPLGENIPGKALQRVVSFLRQTQKLPRINPAWRYLWPTVAIEREKLSL